MKKFLKRFERLENTTIHKDFLPQTESTVSKRFERLEINEKRIEFVLTDKVTEQEKTPQGKQYFFLCPYCGGQNAQDAETCGYCKRPLKKQYIPDYVGKSDLLKKCVCGAVNLKERKNCWVCGRDFSLWGDEEVKESPENIITLNIDGKVYKSTDKDLPEGIVMLMERIRREGYSESIVNEWMQERNEKIDRQQEQTQVRLSQLRWDIFWRSLGILALAGFFLIRIYFAFHRYH